VQAAMGNIKYQWLPILNYVSLAIFVVGLVWWAMWSWLFPNLLSVTIDGHTPYLLSAIAQSLAAVLALVFTISLIVAQISARYSHRVFAVFFDVYTICFIALFVAAVLLPLWLLGNQDPSVIGVKYTLTLSSVCLILLIPYFIRFRVKLTPEYMLAYLANKTLVQLRANPFIEPEDVIKIQDFVMSAFALKDYETCREGIETIAFLAYKANQLASLNPPKSLSLIYMEFYNRLRDIFIITAADPMIPNHVVEALFSEGMRALDENPALVKQINVQLRNLAHDAVDKKLDGSARKAVLYIFGLSRRLAERDWKLLDQDTIWILREIGIKSAEKGLNKTLNESGETIMRIGITLIESGQGSSFVKEIVAELSKLYVGVSNATHESDYSTCERLTIMGTISHILGILDIRDHIISTLKATIGTDARKNHFLKMKTPSTSIRIYGSQYENFNAALDEFTNMAG
jgi:hypothetical protein